MSATLYIVPTPIGNLQDVSFRQIDTLKQVDLIACEDTRHSAKLLQHLGITTSTISLHQHNETQRSSLLIDKLQSGQNIALISDAGTPLINDPGYELVKRCRDEHIRVEALPGPCAFVTALSASGLPTDRFCYAGFFPIKQQARMKALEALADEGITYAYYESPKRILSSLSLIQAHFPMMQVVVAKELTKAHENYVGNSATSVIEWLNGEAGRLKGEFVLLLRQEKTRVEGIPTQALKLLEVLSKHLPPKNAAGIVAEHYDLNKKQLYQRLIE